MEAEAYRCLFPSMITGATRIDAGTQVTFECWCGAPQTAIRGGATRDDRDMVAA